MGKNTVQGAEKRAFTRLFMDVCNWNNYWERWNDMLWMFATSIANVVDLENREEREKIYRQIAGKYSAEEMTRFSELFKEMVNEYERKPFQDFLGSIYMELDMGSDAHGQFFTPYNVCAMMAHLEIDKDLIEEMIRRRGWISVNDCASGAGALLVAAAERLKEIGINYQEHCLFVAQDLDSTVAMMCYIQLSMLGCPGYVRIGDTLTEPPVYDLLLGDPGSKIWRTPMYYSSVWTGRRLCRILDSIMQSGRKVPEKPKAEPPAAESPKPKAPAKPRKEDKPNDDGERTIQLSIFQ